MEVNTLTTSGKWATTTNWSKGHVPTTSEQASIPAGKEAKVEAAAEYGSLLLRGKLAGTFGMVVGGSEAGPSNVLVDMVGAESMLWTGVFTPATTASVAQTIATGGFTLTGRVSPFGEGVKIKLLENLVTAGLVEWTSGLGVNVFDLNGKTLQGSSIMLATPEVLATNAKIVSSGTGTASMQVTGTVVGSASCTLELNNTGVSERQMVLTGSKKWGKLIAVGNVQITGSPTVETELAVNSKGAAATKGVRITKGTIVILAAGAVLTTNGTEAEPARLESSEAGKAGTLKVTTEQEVSWLKIKDITVTGGPLYDNNGTDEGGNLTVGTTLIFTAKPSGVLIELAAAVASSTASLALTAQTQVPLAAATSASAAELAVTAKTRVPLAAAVSASTSTLALTAATFIPLTPATSSSAATLNVTAPTQIPLSPAQAASAASMTVTTPGAAVLLLAPAVAASQASLGLNARTQVPLAPAASSSNATTSLTARTLVALNPAVASSTASCLVTVAVESHGVRMSITNRKAVNMTITNYRGVNIQAVNRKAVGMARP